MSKEFSLSENFLNKYKKKKPSFGFGGVGEIAYMRSYSRVKPDNTNEQWHETVARVVNGTYNMQKRHIDKYGLRWIPQKAQRSAQEMYKRIFSMKFLPPGRGLFAMGSAITEERHLYAALNNCLAYETEFITKDGIKKLGDCVGTEQIILTKNGRWVSASIKSYGEQELMKVTLVRQGKEKIIFATLDHLWFAKSQYEINKGKGYSEYETENLKNGYRLQYVFGQGIKNVRPSSFGIAHGITFGDGSRGHIYLCGEKNKELKKWFINCHCTYDKNKSSEGALRIADLPYYFKEKPSLKESKSYLYGWLAGYLAADGTCDCNGQVYIDSTNKKNILFVRSICAVLGIGTWSIQEIRQTSNLTGKDFKLHRIGLMRDTLTEDFFLISNHRTNYIAHQVTKKSHWNVISVERTNRLEQVYCAEVKKYTSFVLADNILIHNCAFVSTENLREDPVKPFTFLMDASMCGVGVGFDTKGEETVLVKGISENNRASELYIIPDTREGWVESVKLLLESYFYGLRSVEFDYSEIRAAGEPIRGFGGTSAGSGPLKELHIILRESLDEMAGEYLSTTMIVDIMNLIGKCVVSGGVRRTAEIVFGDYESDEYLDLKNYSVNPHREAYGWASNNSIMAHLGMDYGPVCDRTRINGEPGFAWLENMQGYSRIMNGPDYKDKRATGGNPCLEQTLESYELCCLVETFPDNHETFEDYQKTLKFAYLYAKTVTLGLTHWPETNQVMIRNRRIGCSMSGIAQFITHRGINELRDWTQNGYDTIQQYDEIYSDWLGIPLSKKTTSIKPSGTVSLLAGATPGMHYPESRYYIRRMELSINSPLIDSLTKANYVIVESKRDPENTVLVEVPVDVGEGIRTAKELSMWEQLSLAAFLQRYWADNQVSCTVTFDPETEGSHIKYALDFFQYQLKGVSFYPRMGSVEDKIKSFIGMLEEINLEGLSKHNQARIRKVLEYTEKLDIKSELAYEQPPYEEIDEKTYYSLSSNLKVINFKGIKGATPTAVDKFCDGDFCELPTPS